MRNGCGFGVPCYAIVVSRYIECVNSMKSRKTRKSQLTPADEGIAAVREDARRAGETLEPSQLTPADDGIAAVREDARRAGETL